MCRERRLPLFGDNGKNACPKILSHLSVLRNVLFRADFLRVKVLLPESPCEAAVSRVPRQGSLREGRALSFQGSSVHVRVWPLACPAQDIRDPALTQSVNPPGSSCSLVLPCPGSAGKGPWIDCFPILKNQQEELLDEPRR